MGLFLLLSLALDVAPLPPPAPPVTPRTILLEKHRENTAWKSSLVVLPPRTNTLHWDSAEPVQVIQFRTNLNAPWAVFRYQTNWYVGHGMQRWPTELAWQQAITNNGPQMFFRVGVVNLSAVIKAP